MTSAYRVGIGLEGVTDPAIGLQMQGFADKRQKTGGGALELYSRAFIVEDQAAGRRVAIVVADIWAVTRVVKQAVMKRVREQAGLAALYNNDNVLISGTHTHSAPGGYAGYRLYDLTGEGFDKHTFECVVTGIVNSILAAHSNLAPGKVYMGRTRVPGCGQNRSLDAYNNNPPEERASAGEATDPWMMVLRFNKRLEGGAETPVGALSWFPIHPTDLGQMNRRVCGDNKGYAAALFEARMTTYPGQNNFAAAFANAHAGDVSGNVEYGRIPNGIDDFEHMRKHGRQQYDKARECFDGAREELSGSIDYRHTHVDMAQVTIDGDPRKRTWPAALGLSFAAGSREDGKPEPDILLREGITVDNATVTEKGAWVAIGTLAPLAERIPNASAFPPEVQAGHFPKPILFALGASPDLVPSILPLQILKIGQLALAGVPAEFTTMAGRRLCGTLLHELGGAGVQYVQLAGYANDY